MTSTWWQRLLGTSTGPRVSGLPTSSNGASSLHLGWVLPGRFTAAEVTLEVLEAPSVPRLYFWAVQADMASEGRRAGGAHLGLQWHPRHPGSTAVNWGGYRSGGGELSGTRSELPSALHNANTRDFSWRPGQGYRLRIERVEEAPADGPPGSTAWRGSVTDLERGAITVVRDLFIEGDHISGLTMWSEVFARCDDPPASVRWSDPSAWDVSGQRAEPSALMVNYQTAADGGCENTTSFGDGMGAIQRTNTERVTAQGARLAVRGGSG